MAEVEDFIRNNNFMPKIKKEWSKRFGESLPENLVSSALKVAWARNEFVHYKWLPRLEDEDKAHDAATAEAVREAASLVEPLLKIEDRLAFNGEYSRLTRILDDLYLK